jgi:hypothetical protein
MAFGHAPDRLSASFAKPHPFPLHHPGDFHEELLSSGFLAKNLTELEFLFYNIPTNRET